MSDSSKLKVKMLRGMIQIRMFEEKIQDLFNQGQIPGSMHLSTGQEAVPVGFCLNLSGDDKILASHRGHGQVIAKGGEYKYMLAELYGRKTGYCKGKGGSMHIAYSDIGVLGANGIVGGGICIAAGVGFSSRYLKEDNVTLCFLGDGATNTGAFHEGINFASVHKANVVFIIENNQYAISVPRKSSDCVEDLSIRAKAYGIPGETIDGNDVIKVYETAGKAIKRARSGGGPSLIECKTYRWHGHHAAEPADGSLYRPKEEISLWRKKCPILRFEKLLLKENILSREDIDKIREGFEQELQDGIKFAKESPFPEIKDMYEDVYVSEVGK